MPSIHMKIVSAMEKCFYDDAPQDKREQTEFLMFRNERLSFQILYRTELEEKKRRGAPPSYPLCVEGDLASYTRVRLVSNVLNMYPILAEHPGGEFISTEPGAYPDMIRPFVYPNEISFMHEQTHALWVDVELPEGFAAGQYELSFSVLRPKTGEILGKVTAKIQVLDVELPKQSLIHTEWFYTDCIANYYRVKPFSEKHWKLVESFMRVAGQNGINMILTPVFTPELDTYVGGERLTTQLVDIERAEDGRYVFGFDKLHRWIDLALSCGMEYFEIPHFFTQWGAKAAPKIVVKVKGRNKKLFGWHTDSLGEEYETFLSQFIPALLAEFKKRGLDQKCYFHVSDEPRLACLEHYARCKELIAKYLKGYPIIDALSDFAFYSTGALEKPVPHTRGIMPFIEAEVKGLWTYHCGGGLGGVSDRSIAMPSRRTRVLGVQLYYYGIEGFLHWGYNFYNSRCSYSTMDPYGFADGGFFTPGGNSFLVYPGDDGTAWESIRLNVLRMAMDDMRALSLYESKFGKEATRRLILEDTDGELTFVHYPTDPDYLPNLRDKIARAFLK